MKLVVFFLALTGAIAADPANFAARKTNIRKLLDARDFAAALPLARAINKEWPDDIEGYQLVAGASLGTGDYQEAETAIQWMFDLRIGKADAQGWLLLAHLREVIGDIDGAIEAVNQGYSRIGPGHDTERAELAAYSGYLYCKNGRLQMAEEALRQAHDLPLAVSTLARIRLAQGRREDAIVLLRQLATSDKRPEYLYQLAEATGAAADYDAFVKAARRVVDLPFNANRELVLYLSLTRPAEALSLAKSELIHRHDIWTLDALAVAYFAAGQPEPARATMNRILAIGTRDPAILKHAATMGIRSF